MTDCPYEPDQWTAILAVVGMVNSDIEAKLETDLTRAIRRYWEHEMDTDFFGSGKEQRVRWAKVEATAEALGKAIASIRHDWLVASDKRMWAEELNDLAERASKAVGIAEWMKTDFDLRVHTFAEGRHPARRQLYGDILLIWTDLLKRDLGVSRKRTAQGPLIRFLQATLRPILKSDTPGPEGLAKIIYLRKGKIRPSQKSKKSKSIKAFSNKPGVDALRR